MNQLQLSDSIMEWMQNQRTNAFLIRKDEQTDIDQIRIDVAKVEAKQFQTPDLDDYVSDQTILIHGEGTVIGDMEAPLPQSVYEIPIEGSCTVHTDEALFQITTDRATYTFIPYTSM
jgi:hypothetical protein